jgi:hypothetical protein
MPRTEEDLFFEERQSKLATFLKGGRPTGEDPTDEDMRKWYEARTMLCAPDLLEACEYALTLISMLSTEDFSAGGDRPARTKLAEAIDKAKEGTRRAEEQTLERRCAEDIKGLSRGTAPPFFKRVYLYVPRNGFRPC